MIGLEDTRAGLRRVERLNLTLSAGAVAASLALAESPGFAGSLAAGALMEALNFRSLHGSARRFFAGQLGGGGLWLGVVGLRLGALGACIVLALVAGAHPVALVIGLSMVIPATLIDAWRHRPPVLAQPDHPVPPPEDPAWDRFSVWNFQAMDEPADPWTADEVADAEVVATPDPEREHGR